MKTTVIVALALALPVLAGCVATQPRAGGNERQYSSQQYGQPNALRQGTAIEGVVVNVREVMIQPQANGSSQALGVAAGGALGALAGSSVGNGRGKTATGILGAVGGAVAGAALTERGPVPGQEIIIRRAGSEKLAVVTQADSNLVVGERVLVMDVGGEIRVSRFSGGQ